MFRKFILVLSILICGFGIGFIGSMGIMYYLFEYLNVSI
jgi:hypothetical protein